MRRRCTSIQLRESLSVRLSVGPLVGPYVMYFRRDTKFFYGSTHVFGATRPICHRLYGLIHKYNSPRKVNRILSISLIFINYRDLLLLFSLPKEVYPLLLIKKTNRKGEDSKYKRCVYVYNFIKTMIWLPGPEQLFCKFTSFKIKFHWFIHSVSAPQFKMVLLVATAATSARNKTRQ